MTPGCNIFTVQEIRDLSLLKVAFRMFHSKFSELINGGRRSWPLLPVERFRTTLAQQSIPYRAIRLWNSLPRSWTAEISYSKFIDQCKELIISKRDNG